MIKAPRSAPGRAYRHPVTAAPDSLLRTESTWIVWCAASGCTTPPLRGYCPTAELEAAPNAEAAPTPSAQRTLALNGWHQNHGEWVCPAHRPPTPAPAALAGTMPPGPYCRCMSLTCPARHYSTAAAETCAAIADAAIAAHLNHLRTHGTPPTLHIDCGPHTYEAILAAIADDAAPAWNLRNGTPHIADRYPACPADPGADTGGDTWRIVITAPPVRASGTLPDRDDEAAQLPQIIATAVHMLTDPAGSHRYPNVTVTCGTRVWAALTAAVTGSTPAWDRTEVFAHADTRPIRIAELTVHGHPATHTPTAPPNRWYIDLPDHRPDQPA
jgi:hypothetical protein